MTEEKYFLKQLSQNVQEQCVMVTIWKKKREADTTFRNERSFTVH